jgi:hypothetical protein
MRLPLVILCLLAFMLTLADGAFAQRRSSFGGSRSSSSSSSPSRSYSSPSSRPSSSPSSSFGGSRSSSSYSTSRPSYSSPSRSYSSQPRSTQSFGGSRSSSPSSSYRTGGSQSSARSYGVPRKETYNGQSFSYRNNSNAVPVSGSSAMIPRNYTSSYNDVYARRNSYYSGMNYMPPSYIGYASPSYGLFSTMFLMSALSNMQAQQNAAFFYNQWNNPGMMAWRNDMQTAARTDPEAATKIRDLETRVAQMEREKNGVRDTTYMPEGVDSSVVLSNEALGVQDNTQPPIEQTAASEAKEEKRSGGLGFFGWFLIIGGGLGVWWFLRQRKARAAANSENGGSFS